MPHIEESRSIAECLLSTVVIETDYIQRRVGIESSEVATTKRDSCSRVVARVNSIANGKRLIGSCFDPLPVLFIYLLIRRYVHSLNCVTESYVALNALNAGDLW